MTKKINVIKIGKKYRQNKTYSYHPKDIDELHKILKKLLEERGNDADLNDIDVSKVTDMNCLFEGINLLGIDPHNIDISEWDVSNVTNMFRMFRGCKNFNCDLSNWNVSNVETMEDMFYNCHAFNSDLSNWDVSNVMNMSFMFYNCQKFNCDLDDWYIKHIPFYKMRSVFNGCKNLENIPSWYKKL